MDITFASHIAAARVRGAALAATGDVAGAVVCLESAAAAAAEAGLLHQEVSAPPRLAAPWFRPRPPSRPKSVLGPASLVPGVRQHEAYALAYASCSGEACALVVLFCSDARSCLRWRRWCTAACRSRTRPGDWATCFGAWTARPHSSRSYCDPETACRRSMSRRSSLDVRMSNRFQPAV